MTYNRQQHKWWIRHHAIVALWDGNPTLSDAEIAQRLGCSISAVSRHLRSEYTHRVKKAFFKTQTALRT